MTQSDYLTGLSLAILAATGFACKAIFVKLAYRYGVDATTLVTIRLLLVLPLIAMMRLFRRAQTTPLSWHDRSMVFLLGILGYYLASLFDFIGLETVSASIERLILCLYPTLTVLLSAWWNKTTISRRMWCSMLLTYCGMAIVLAPDLAGARLDLPGMLFVVASTISYALYLTWSPPVIKRIGAMRFAELALTMSAISMFVHYALTRPITLLTTQPLPVWGYGLIMVLVATVLPLYALSAAMARIGAGKTALIGSLGPVLTLFMSMGLLDEYLTPLQWGGVCVVLTGIWLVGQRKT